MKVPLLDLKPQYQALKGDIDAAIARVCDSQHFILGPAIRELETGVAAYCQTAHGIGVSSGTDALLLALMALGIGNGDEVITSAFAGSYAVTATAPSKSVPVTAVAPAARCAWPRGPALGVTPGLEAPTRAVRAPAMSVAAPCWT